MQCDGLPHRVYNSSPAAVHVWERGAAGAPPTAFLDPPLPGLATAASGRPPHLEVDTAAHRHVLSVVVLDTHVVHPGTALACSVAVHRVNGTASAAAAHPPQLLHLCNRGGRKVAGGPRVAFRTNGTAVPPGSWLSAAVPPDDDTDEDTDNPMGGAMTRLLPTLPTIRHDDVPPRASTAHSVADLEQAMRVHLTAAGAFPAASAAPTTASPSTTTTSSSSSSFLQTSGAPSQTAAIAAALARRAHGLTLSSAHTLDDGGVGLPGVTGDGMYLAHGSAPAAPFRRYRPGRIKWLTHEVNRGGAAVVGSNGPPAHMAGPAHQGAELVVAGAAAGVDVDVVWLPPAWPASTFDVGEVVLLTGFSSPGNAGVFVVAAHHPGNAIRLGEVLPSSTDEGRVVWLAHEVNVDGGQLVTASGAVVGPATRAAPIVVLPDAATRAALRFSAPADDATNPLRPSALLFVHPSHLHASGIDVPAGSIVSLQGFHWRGNHGVFRVLDPAAHGQRHVGAGALLLTEVQPCRGGHTRWLTPEMNRGGASALLSVQNMAAPHHDTRRRLPSAASPVAVVGPANGTAPLVVLGHTDAALLDGSVVATAGGEAAPLARRGVQLGMVWVPPDVVPVPDAAAAARSLRYHVVLDAFAGAGNAGRFVLRAVRGSVLVLGEVSGTDAHCPEWPQLSVTARLERESPGPAAHSRGFDGRNTPVAVTNPVDAPGRVLVTPAAGVEASPANGPSCCRLGPRCVSCRRGTAPMWTWRLRCGCWASPTATP